MNAITTPVIPHADAKTMDSLHLVRFSRVSIHRTPINENQAGHSIGSVVVVIRAEGGGWRWRIRCLSRDREAQAIRRGSAASPPGDTASIESVRRSLDRPWSNGALIIVTAERQVDDCAGRSFSASGMGPAEGGGD